MRENGPKKEAGMKGSKESKSQEGSSADQLKNFDKALGEISNKMFKEGMSPKDAMEVNPQVLENIYAQAYRLYNTGKYVEASHLFRILIMINSLETKYMLGLAACFHMLKEYQNAI